MIRAATIALVLCGCSSDERPASVQADPVSLDTAAVPPSADPADWAGRQVAQLDDAPSRAAYRSSAMAAVHGYERWLRAALDRIPEEQAGAARRSEREARLDDVRTRLRRVVGDLDDLPESGWAASAPAITEDLREIDAQVTALASRPPALLRR